MAIYTLAAVGIKTGHKTFNGTIVIVVWGSLDDGSWTDS
jgi:uncharacterized protein (DUF342 family)